jgi:hypothetical protein
MDNDAVLKPGFAKLNVYTFVSELGVERNCCNDYLWLDTEVKVQ